jgi:hypothetical protein
MTALNARASNGRRWDGGSSELARRCQNRPSKINRTWVRSPARLVGVSANRFPVMPWLRRSPPSQSSEIPRAPGHVVKPFAFCPRGYYVTGGGACSGAISEIASGPTKDLRGWFVHGAKDDPMKRTFQHRAHAVCVEASARVVVTTAATSGTAPTREDEAAFASRHKAAPGR